MDHKPTSGDIEMRCQINILQKNKNKYTNELYDQLQGQNAEVLYKVDEEKTRVQPDVVVKNFWGNPSTSWAIYSEDIILTTLL